MQRLTDLLRGLLGTTTALALIAAIPIGLIATVGWPLPTSTPSVELIWQHLRDGEIPDTFVIKTLAVIVWGLWAQLTVALGVETAAAVRGKAARRAPVLPGLQLLAAKLVTWVTIMVTALGPVRPVTALPLTALTHSAQVFEPAATSTLAPGPGDASRVGGTESSATAAHAEATKQYRTVRGDSWWSIAEQTLGDAMRWPEVRDLNIGRTAAPGALISSHTESLRTGWLLLLPADARVPAQPIDDTTSAHGAEIVTVEQGDHFWKLAEAQLADSWGREPTDSETAPYWRDVVDTNLERLAPPHDPNLIYPGQQFLLPPTPANPDIDIDLNGDDVVTNPDEVVAEQPAEPESVPADTGSTPSTEVPATPVPTAPETERPESTVSQDNDRAGNESGSDLDDLARPIATIGGAGLIGAMLLYSLRRLRRIQAARRRPGTVTDPPDEEAAAYETRVRAIASDGEDVPYLAAANAYLSHQLEQHHRPEPPSLVVARAGDLGVELLLDAPCEPVPGFHSTSPDQTSWRLDPDLTPESIEELIQGDAHPYAPALLTVGGTDTGNLLVDFEQLGMTTLHGAPEAVAGFQRGLLTSAIAAPWAKECRFVAIGIVGLDPTRIEQPDDPIAWAQHTAETMSRLADHATHSPYDERVHHGDVTYPTIVVVGPDASHTSVVETLEPVALHPHTPLVLITATPAASEYRIHIDDDVATLEPLGIAFQPVEVAVEDLAAAQRLLTNAADTHTGPPAAWTTDNNHDGDTQVAVSNDPATSAPAGIGPSRETLDLVAGIMTPRSIEVSVLGRRPVINGLDEPPTGKLEAIVGYLAFHGEVPVQRLRDEFWPNSPGRQACDQALMRIRSALGSDASGEPRLPSARATGTYALSADVGCDWQRVQQLLTAANGVPVGDETQLLDAVCELIDGHVGADVSTDTYSWLLRDPTTYSRIETTLTDAAHRRAELALEAGDIERAEWAARKGLEVVEGQEALYRIRMQAAAEAGDTDGINAAYRQAQRAAESYGCDEEVQPETQALYDSLTERKTTSRRSTLE